MGKKKLTGDVEQLSRASAAIEATSVRMRRATLEYLWDKFITHADTAPAPVSATNARHQAAPASGP